MSTLVDSAENPSPTIMAAGQNKGVGFIEARAVHDTSGQFSVGDVTDRPAPTVTAQGLHLFVENVPTPPEGDGPSLERFAIGREMENLKPGESSSKFFSLTRPDVDEPCPCVTAAGGNVSAASVVHPVERRKFTIAELRRICAFPDDFILTGTYQQQWERLGRAVPPVMMYHIARSIRDQVFRAINQTEEEGDGDGLSLFG